MAGLIHYQPLTGPVWREPVAAALAWLPRGEPARPLERRIPSEFVYPPFYELYQPSSLSWLPSGRWPLPPEVRKLGDFQQPPFDALYKPEQLGWRPAEPPPRTIFEVRKPSEFAQPAFDALYKSEQLGWIPSVYYVGRGLQRGTLDLTVFPVQFAAPVFDPQNLEWIPKGTPPRTVLEVREASDLVQPPFDSLYKPEGLQWLFQGQLSVRGIPYTLQSSWVVDPNPVVTVAFDPQFFPFQATDIVLARTLQAAIQSGYATPPLPPGPDVIPPTPAAEIPAIRNFSLREWRKWHRPEDERELRKLHLTPAVAEVIAEVAERQAQTLEADERKRIKELTRELELKRLRFQARYLELLNTERQQLIDAEIKSFYEAETALDEENKRRLLLLLTFLS